MTSCRGNSPVQSVCEFRNYSVIQETGLQSKTIIMEPYAIQCLSLETSVIQEIGRQSKTIIMEPCAIQYSVSLETSAIQESGIQSDDYFGAIRYLKYIIVVVL